MANRIAVACVVATVAFWAYTRTLVPGVDLGDTGGFQAAVLWPAVSARQAYPLYYNLARPFVVATCGSRLQPKPNCDPARALNLFSAIAAAMAVGLLAFFTATLTGTLASGIVAGLLLAFSYTFWSQAIIAEVYALHLALVVVCLIALYSYGRKPTRPRLAAFFAVYAASFGNHLSMILLLGPFALFLLLTTPDRRMLFRPGVVVLAFGAAIGGALQYWPNLLSVMTDADPPAAWSDRIAAFWFDTTKADWRESMVFGVEATRTFDRLAMWWFDARQQFGVAGLGLAAAGAIRLSSLSRPWFALVAAAFATTTAFALSYNVGDSHVFFVPSHLFTALCAGVAVASVVSRTGGRRVGARHVVLALAGLALLYCGWRAWSTWPAVDRHEDRRGEQLIARLTLGIGDPDTMLVSQMNWELENVLLYVARHRRPGLTWTRLGDVLPHFPFLIEDQRDISRDVVLTAEAASEVIRAYGPLLTLVEDPILPVSPLAVQAERIPGGVPYVLTVLTPPPEETFDADDLAAALARLTRDRLPARGSGRFELVAGVTGEKPSVYRVSDRPFTVSFNLLDEPFTVRLDSWLPFDTFRRPGFGHVLRGREHVQILERGVNLVWLGYDGRAAPPIYAASTFAPQPRYRVLAGNPAELARTGRAAQSHAKAAAVVPAEP